MPVSYAKPAQRAGWLSQTVLTMISALAMGHAALAADGKDVVMNGVGEAPACQSCHGENGEGQPDAGFPRLSGLSPIYMMHQIQSFTDGTRQNDVMQPIATALSQDDRKAVTGYLAALTPPKAAASEAPDPKLAADGAAIAANGLWAKGVPGCDQCHGMHGQGVGTAFPKLAGQSSAYIVSQLQAWKDGTRHNDPLGLMKGIAGKLDDDQIKAVADYYASLDPLHPLDTMEAVTKGAAQ